MRSSCGRRQTNERGGALIVSYLAVASLMILAGTTYGQALAQRWAVDREITKIQGVCAAEAGLQSALAQIADEAYTGAINTAAIEIPTFQSIAGDDVGEVSVAIDYPNEADWVVVTAEATVNGQPTALEGRVFLESNLSKYLVYADTGNFSSGTNAQYGSSDGVNPMGVSANEKDRAAMYFTGDWSVTGSNVTMYGDVHTETQIAVTGSGHVYGDSYASTFAQNGSGTVTDDGVDGTLTIADGFSDDSDRDGSGAVTSADAPDRHDLTEGGSGDAHALDELTAIDLAFYAEHNDMPTFAGATAKDRFLKLEASGDHTVVKEYKAANYNVLLNTYALPANAIVYVNGSAYVKGQINGRVSVVSSNDVYLEGNVSYGGGQTTADPTHSAAFLAQDKIFFRANTLSVSGILYGENESSSSVVFDSNYNTNGQQSPGTKVSLHLYGNRVMVGSTNLGNYPTRIYDYDANLKYYRPPGIPVVPELRVVREVAPGGV